jgi:hypothetical protein
MPSFKGGIGIVFNDVMAERLGEEYEKIDQLKWEDKKK